MNAYKKSNLLDIEKKLLKLGYSHRTTMNGVKSYVHRNKNYKKEPVDFRGLFIGCNVDVFPDGSKKVFEVWKEWKGIKNKEVVCRTYLR